jgi:predicted anti-sigma-YlaC factor YlaD
MKCDKIRERMPDVAAGLSQLTSEESNHLATCNACDEKLKEMRSTMALLDEWQVPEPSPYFDVRLQARFREEAAKPQPGWLHWFRHPVLAAALTVIMGMGIGLYVTHSKTHSGTDASVSAPAPPGSAVSDLQTLDKNHDMYSDFDLLDDLAVQQNVVANP